MNKEKLKKNLRLFADNGVNLVLLSLLTGLFSGVVVTFYNILAHIGEETSVELYSLLRDNPAFIPLLFLGLAAGALVIGTFVRFVPMIRGSGIPQIEGAARGIIRFKWYVTMCSMFAASLACIFLGLSAGAEGPSLEIGGCAGEAVGKTLKRNQMIRRLQIAGGSSAGLAVAFNAPVTGLFFAMEEAFRSFSPQVFICAALSIVTALFTRNSIQLGIYGEKGLGFTFNTFLFPDNFSFMYCVWVIPAAIIVALAGVGFYHAVFATKKLFKKITFFKKAGKYLIPFLLAGAFGLITAYAMGGGSSFIKALGTNGTGEIKIESIFGISIVASLFIVFIFKYIAGVLAMGCGVPCGVFIPMLAMGAGLGAILSIAFMKMGMDPKFCDCFIIICMSVFFTTIVKAPITGIVMVFELTGQFTNFLPVLLGVAIGYLLSMLFKLEPIYEKNLDGFIAEEKLYENVKKERVTVTVQPHSKADMNKVRSIIWPTNGLVVEVTTADGTTIVPDGEYTFNAGDTLVFECETDSVEELYGYLYAIVGKPEKREED
ncbi:MAG: ClC family H(+)/Cl(-) exchange transporter [Clostridia bacterium]|nr:ClC family H(+)/Cl(-) exchange transporter [Clostridia bacterium]